MNPIESLQLQIDIAQIKKKAARKGSMSMRWWQNRIYGLQFGTHSEPTDKLRSFIIEAVIITEMVLEDTRVSRSKKNNLRGYLNGLRDAKLALESASA